MRQQTLGQEKLGRPDRQHETAAVWMCKQGLSHIWLCGGRASESAGPLQCPVASWAPTATDTHILRAHASSNLLRSTQSTTSSMQTLASNIFKSRVWKSTELWLTIWTYPHLHERQVQQTDFLLLSFLRTEKIKSAEESQAEMDENSWLENKRIFTLTPPHHLIRQHPGIECSVYATSRMNRKTGICCCFFWHVPGAYVC